MIEAPTPRNEEARLAALGSYQVLDTDPEEAFDDLVQVAARICGTPIALVSLIDERRQWFKARTGLAATETPRAYAFCAHAILEPEEVLVVPDAYQDLRFHDNPLVTGDPNVVFYAGAPLVTPEGLPLGTLCVIDHEPRELSDDDRETLRSLARATVTQLELRKAATELRSLSEELSRSNQDLERRNVEIERFYQGLSHELKTPLTVMREYVSLVLDGLAGPINDEQRDFLAIGRESCDRMARDIDDLLEVTRIQTGKLRLDVQKASVSRLLESTEVSLRRAAEEAGIRLSCTPDSNLPPVAADEGRIIQVVANLAKNAIKFTPRGGDILIAARVTKDGRHIEVSVSDSGRGIPKEDLPRIFDRLYQCQDDDASSRRGLGIGLYLCEQIVELHGGWIEVDSEVGVGTTFRFYLPVVGGGVRGKRSDVGRGSRRARAGAV